MKRFAFRPEYAVGILAISFATAAPAQTITARETGPRSNEEAELILHDGLASFQQKDWKAAELQLARFVHRYPIHKRYREGQTALAETYLASQNPRLALALFRELAASKGKTDEADRLRIRLARAYLALKKPHEAHLLTTQILSLQSPQKSKVLLPEHREAALLVRGWADLQLKNPQEIQASLQGLGPSLEKSALTIAARLAECEQLPSSGILTEAQFLDQIERRGSCLKDVFLSEATQSLWLPPAVEPVGPPWIAPLPLREETLQRLKNKAGGYREICTHPNRPPGKRTPQELRAYQDEITDQCRRLSEKTFQFLREHPPAALAPSEQALWRNLLPPS